MCSQDAQQRAMSHDVWTLMITSNPSLRNKSLRARNKATHVELLLGLARPMPRYAVTVTYGNQQRKAQKRFSLFRKKQSEKQKKNIDDFRNVGVSKYRMRYAIYMPQNIKDLTINQTMVAYGNRQNAKAFARANNSDLLRSLTHLMETRLHLLILYKS